MLRTLKARSGGVWGVAIAPDGKTIAASTGGGNIELWRIDGTELTTLYGHKGVIWLVKFSNDGKKLASASDDRTIILWDVKRILNLDPLAYGCNWVRDYLRTNAEVKEEDRHLCDGSSNNAQKE